PLPQTIRAAVSLAFEREFVRQFVSHLYGLVVILGKPRSRGSVELGGDRAEPPALIDPAYFSHADDLDAMVSGLELARRIAGAQSLREWGAREVFPGGIVSSRSALAAFARANAMT